MGKETDAWDASQKLHMHQGRELICCTHERIAILQRLGDCTVTDAPILSTRVVGLLTVISPRNDFHVLISVLTKA